MGVDSEPDGPRQSVVKAPGRVRRAKLTPAPHTDPSPEAPRETRNGTSADAADVASAAGAAHQHASKPGENDDRLRRDRPPHW
ncbi:hypothetical protein [Glaciibacter sp. 2TAF33]|uniref:hypothetical protein n=1 Tax=Glaciibacter sp. 2TAF33 TaxID=3233015 RepID=UPI003F8EB59D